MAQLEATFVQQSAGIRDQAVILLHHLQKDAIQGDCSIHQWMLAGTASQGFSISHARDRIGAKGSFQIVG
jgi:hypothetical protein